MAEIWSSVPFHIFLGLAAGLPFVLWDWRVALPGLLLVQLGTGTLMGSVYTLPAPWPTVQFGVLLLACLILMLSILQTRSVQVDQSGEFSSILFRALVLGIAALWVSRAGDAIPLPIVNDATRLLFLWFAVLALLTLGLAETVLLGGIALLLWMIPVQAFLSLMFPSPAIVVPLGILQLLVALACSYLLLAEESVLWSIEVPATDPGLVSGTQHRLSIVAGARILWYGFTYWLYSLASRRQQTAVRKG